MSHAYAEPSQSIAGMPAPHEIRGSTGSLPTWRIVRRFLVPQFVGRLAYLARDRAMISPRAEVEYSGRARFGRGCVVSSFTKIKVNGTLRVGERTHIATGCFIDVSPGGLEIGAHTLIGPNCTIITNNYRYDRLDVPLHEQGNTSRGVHIGRNVWLGANCVVLDGSDIGDNVIVSAGSVVSGALPPNTIAHGNPAQAIFTRR